MTGGVLAPTLPEALTTAARALHDFADPVAMRRRVAVLSLRRWTAGGFEPVPPATAPRALSDADRLRGDPQAPVLWAPDPDSCTLCAANGHETRTRLAPDEVRRLTRALSGPDPVAVGALLNAVAPGARRDVGRALLERLESFRAFHRTP